ncbi:rhodanese-like domain-containing protein [Emcibacter sp. SYSU 3D8]|uniref:rhodanese-like domain-containing protein n=1 Tax=Emcibacter sp. SYSU 3D8 TaxID=3133969 RepID=UPI0031FF4479
MSEYADDLSPQDAWKLLESEPSAILVDVRTRAEWNYVGVADLSPLSKKPAFIEWQTFPQGQRNERFADEVDGLGIDRTAPILFLCRSGARSAAAARLMTQKGYARCYNVSEGFEGDPDDARHRGRVNGWKARGLPWTQN